MRFQISVAGALIGACLFAVPAAASPFAGALSKGLASPSQAGVDLLKVQLSQTSPAGVGRGNPGVGRGVSGGGRSGNRGGGGYRGGRGGYRGHGGGDDGAGVAVGVLGGLLLGAIIANEAQRSNSVEACARRYRSYDRRSQTFIGSNGVRYSCP